VKGFATLVTDSELTVMIVAPAFVRRAIEHARALGWDHGALRSRPGDHTSCGIVRRGARK
jgi:hypothetical protein